jgi:carotenoid cleavage dioxygenase
MSQSDSVEENSTAPENNVYLNGNFAPVSEELTAHDLTVEGEIPSELAGSLLRDGPNPIAPGPDHHWFTGDGMVHGVSIKDGAARSYRNRWIRTEQVEELLGLPAGRISPNKPMQHGSGSVNVIGHGGRILALPEVGLPWELDPDLNTIGQHDFDGALASNMTAHPKIDLATGELVFFGYDFGPVSLRYHTADASGKLIRSVDIAKPVPTMMHDFGVTATRVIFMDLPVAFDMKLAESGAGIPFRWRDDMPARLGILSRDATKDEVQWIEIDPCYVYHPLNAHDDGNEIVLDVVRHDRTFVDGKLAGSGESRLERWIIDPARESVTTEIIDDRHQEFPRVDPRVECHRHRYGYGVAFEMDIGPGPLLKHDLESRTTEVHDVGEQGAASEGVFVPIGAGEDEGYVLSVVYDGATDGSHVRIIDAQNFTAPPVAKIHLPQRVPFGFHGNWIAGKG